MKTFPDPAPNDALLDAVLGDEQWQTTSASARRAASAHLRSRRRQRRIGQWTVGVLAATGLVAGSLWLPRPGGKPAVRVASLQNAPAPTTQSKTLTGEELVALFPKGSCVIAEINGRKELVFFNKDIEANGVFVQNPPRRD
ncbi:MAG: hypothetical protein MUF81_12540 [Verrucomicrobia bacterium]|jgi:hypothetical protein|nr:hypothetical protein [Verrucomicrobiota bacterium]